MICVECGEDAEGLVGGSCATCFAKKHELLSVPLALDTELCAHCDARRVGAHWMDPEEGAPIEWIREDAVRAAIGVLPAVEQPEIQILETPQDTKHFHQRIILHGRVQGVAVASEKECVLRMKRGVCDRCSRMHGGFYAAILQLRATERDVSKTELKTAHRIVAETLARLLRSGNRFAFLAKEGEMHGGWDYYLGDIDAGRQIARELKTRLGASVHEAAKLVGRREGEDVYRVTFLVRIDLFARGDYAATDKLVLRIQSVNRGHAVALDMERHKRTRVPEADLKRLGGDDIHEEAIVVSQGSDGLQLLDPESYQTVTVLVPEGYEVPGETVTVIRHEGRLFLVPVGSPRTTDNR